MTAGDGSHRPVRPHWTCADDGQAWPCAAARKLIADAFDDRDDLARHLAVLQSLAAGELRIGCPRVLYRRFVAWTLDRDEACPACGRRGHRLVVGVPPRLVPCDGPPTLIPPVRPTPGIPLRSPANAGGLESLRLDRSRQNRRELGR